MSKKVMIVENDESVLDVMREALIYGGFEVESAQETGDVFPLLDKHQPDILLVDYLLNGINGGEICHQIKNHEKYHNLPVVIISAYPKVMESLGYYSCDAFIAKPFDMYELIDKITELTNRSSPESV
ncbi:MAG: response regulator [Sphingobacteriaceae bacterium]|nr:MAG: response regulator [Sphingobacteriaceae bacterium]